mgnify:CR=1 FL=1
MNHLYRNKVLLCYLSSSFDVNIKYNKRTIYLSSLFGTLAFCILCYAQFYEYDLFIKFSVCNPLNFRESFTIKECTVHANITDDPRYFILIFHAIGLILLATGLETFFVLWGVTKKHQRFIAHIAHEWNFKSEIVHKLIEFLGIQEKDISKRTHLNIQLIDHRLRSANGLLFANLYLAFVFHNWKEFFSLLIIVLVLTVLPPTIFFTDVIIKILGILCFFMGNIWPIQAFFFLSFLSLQDSNGIILLIYFGLLLLKIPIFILIDRLLLGTSRLQLYRTLVIKLPEEKAQELIKCLEGIPPIQKKKINNSPIQVNN